MIVFCVKKPLRNRIIQTQWNTHNKYKCRQNGFNTKQCRKKLRYKKEHAKHKKNREQATSKQKYKKSEDTIKRRSEWWAPVDPGGRISRERLPAFRKGNLWILLEKFQIIGP